MNELLEILPAKQRDILILRVVVGLSAEEIAAAVGSNTGTVRGSPAPRVVAVDVRDRRGG
uniref:S1620b n=1 Tax=Mycobacterium leprae TaxID=1769 RepID=Q49727_MYCLR|nr:s1620b [Mycobacterium leprae]